MPSSPALNATLARLGWSEALAADIPTGLSPARVASVYAARVDVWTADGPRLASLRSRALRDTEGGIAVGDWVTVGSAGGDEVVVEAVLPRRTVFLRQAAGERAEPQAIAANIDRVFVVTAADSDFNVRRMERYLVAIAAGGASAEIVLTKSDLAADLPALVAQLEIMGPVLVTSAKTGAGLPELVARMPEGITAAVVGSSGVGKSALVNRLLGREAQLVGEVRAYDGRGRHTTTKRELFELPGAGLLIDTPGMRELKPWLPDAPSMEGFDDIVALAQTCRFGDCTHDREPGCAVNLAVERGEVEPERMASWKKLLAEQAERAPRQATFAAHAQKRATRSLEATALRRKPRRD